MDERKIVEANLYIVVRDKPNQNKPKQNQSKENQILKAKKEPKFICITGHDLKSPINIATKISPIFEILCIDANHGSNFK